MAECHIPFTGHCDLDLFFNNNYVMSISLKLFEIGIPNLVCECILRWRSVLYHFRVTVTLTFDLVFRKIVSAAYPIKGRNPKIWCVDKTLNGGVSRTIFGQH